MAYNVKSYTDVEQSKKLAEILPIESADMHYNVVGDAIIGDYQSGISSARSVAKAYKKNPDEFAKNVIPCWSLAALLSVLPKGTRLLKSATDDTYHCDCPKGSIDKWYDSPIDACYEMILKLKEKDLI